MGPSDRVTAGDFLAGFGPNVMRTEYKSVPVVIVGTDHTDASSPDLVDRLMTAVKPSSVAIELCFERVALLGDTPVPPPSTGRHSSILRSMWTSGFFYALHSANLRGAATIGAEFRAVIKHAKATGTVSVYLVDRANSITMRRADAALSVSDKFWLIVDFLRPMPVDQDPLTVRSGFTRNFPALAHTVITERNIVMANNIAAIIDSDSSQSTVVVVCGLAHADGILSLLASWPDSIAGVDIASLEDLPARQFLTPIMVTACTAVAVVSLFLIYR